MLLERGKAAYASSVQASEGLDFADRHARAVIWCAVLLMCQANADAAGDSVGQGAMCCSIGIPMPNTKDTLVRLKRQYNDRRRAASSAAALSGEEWYTQQGFRHAQHTHAVRTQLSLLVAETNPAGPAGR